MPPRRFPAAGLLLAIALLMTPLHRELSACGMGWWPSLERALEVAPEDGRLVVMVFTGNDWGLGSMHLDQRVFEEGEFSYRFGTDFIPVNFDFPQLMPLSDEATAYQVSWAERYQVRSLPTFIVVRPDGSEFARFEYRGESADQMLKLIAGWRERWLARAPISGATGTPTVVEVR
ncbi:MAG: hypothetical protein H0W78_12765 [Planctomycetes bacterium]|nr:hypothetical protein [Planctomycetota bacterium]